MMSGIEKKQEELRDVLERILRQRQFNGLLLSGGLDTSILAYIAAEIKDFEVVTVGFAPTDKPDVRYSRKVASDLGLKQHLKIFDLSEMKRAMERTVKIEETFDPIEVRNSAAVFLALEEAEKKGLNKILTGDGADEIFGGYSFLFDLGRKEQRENINKMLDNMRISSKILSDDLGVDVEIPYTDDEIIGFSKKINPLYLVRKHDGKTYGKWLLRKAFEDLPEEVIWREKAPIEKGTGTEHISEKMDISDDRYNEEKNHIFQNDNVKIRSKTQLYCYKIYKEEFSVPKPEDKDKSVCPYCNSSVLADQNFCRTCGNGFDQKGDAT